MHGQMMNMPLTITSVMEHARLYHADREIISAVDTESTHRTTYEDAFKRATLLANALQTLGCKPGDRIATLAWNDYRHFEIYYAVTCSGTILHTINPRLLKNNLLTSLIMQKTSGYFWILISFHYWRNCKMIYPK